MRAIRLFGKRTVKWKAKTHDDAKKEIDELWNKEIQFHIQQPSSSVIPTKRKKYPYDVEFSYYDWEEIKRMAEYYIKVNEDKNNGN